MGVMEPARVWRCGRAQKAAQALDARRVGGRRARARELETESGGATGEKAHGARPAPAGCFHGRESHSRPLSLPRVQRSLCASECASEC